MYALLIDGGRPLEGEVPVSGAKNAVLPLMAAALLTREPCTIRGVPKLSDVAFMGRILTSLGATVRFQGDSAVIQASRIRGLGHYDLVRRMRASVCIMGPLLARLGRARVSYPGGCVIGPRPIDLHLKGMKSLGARVTIDGGYVCVEADTLRGTSIFLGGRAGPTVLGTANVMMAATLAAGTTVIESAACEPEVADLARFLTAMGAKISGAGSPTITISGVDELHGASHDVIPDRIEAATFAIAAAATRGEVTLTNARPDHMRSVLDKLEEAGAEIVENGKRLTVRAAGDFHPSDVTTQPYAGFPTDVQAQMTVLMTQADGISIITERIFESRFMHVSELSRLGANIAIEGPSAVVKGPTILRGAPVMASDLRASAALVIGGLVAKGQTRVRRIYHLDRGYEAIDAKLRGLGAKVRRISE